MSIVVLLVLLALIGLVAWLLVKYVPMAVPIQRVVIGVAVVACVILALKAFGVWDALLNARI